MAEAAIREDWPRTIEEFDAWHARQPERWEFLWGQVRMMAPASLNHTIIKSNTGFALHRALAESGCSVLVDGAEVRTDEISAIPDIVVTCSALDHRTPAVAEPTIIVEVASPSSERFDPTHKWFAYRKIPSLRHYLVLSQRRREVLVHSRAGDLWHERFITEGAIELADPPLRLAIAEIYAATDIAA